MLDRFKAFANCEPDILRRNVILKRQEGAHISAVSVGLKLSHWTKARKRRRPNGHRAKNVLLTYCLPTFFKTLPEIVSPLGGTDALLGLYGDARHERINRLVEGQLAAGLREQMHRRCPTAGYPDAVAGECLSAADITIFSNRSDNQACHALAAVGSEDSMGCEDFNGRKGVTGLVVARSEEHTTE